MLCTFDTWYTVNGLLKMDFQVELKNNAFNPPRHGILGENKFFPGNLLDHEFHLKNPNLKLHLLSIYSDSRKVIKSIEKAESLLIVICT